MMAMSDMPMMATSDMPMMAMRDMPMMTTVASVTLVAGGRMSATQESATLESATLESMLTSLGHPPLVTTLRGRTSRLQ